MTLLERRIFVTAIIAVGAGCQPSDATAATPYVGPAIGTLSQGWSPEEQEAFWFGNQGSQLLSYDIFLNLEQADSDELFRAPANIERFGYIPWPASEKNPDGLPIGFVKDADRGTGKAWMGFTCAACHTSLVEHDGRTLLIDGAPTLADMPRFLDALLTALRANQERQKLDRLAGRMLGEGATPEATASLLRRLQEETAVLGARLSRNRSEVAYGNGRLDAFGQIFNEVSAHHLGVVTNARPPSAPVSYPFLWGTPQSDVVQWNGVAENAPPFGALNRNVGEVLGVFGDLRILPGDPRSGYPSSVRVVELAKLENLLERLWRPSWREAGLPEPDAASVAKGGAIYQQHCQSCHLRLDDPTDQRRHVATRRVMLDKIDTDRRMALSAVDSYPGTGLRQTGRLEGSRPVQGSGELPFRAEDRSLAIVSKAVAGALSHAGPDTYAAVLIDQCDLTAVELEDAPRPSTPPASDLGLAAIVKIVEEVRDCHDRPLDERLGTYSRAMHPKMAERIKGVEDFATLVGRPPAPSTIPCEDERANGLLCYRARPLDGIWATAPYLHNGSVPTLADLLKPPDQRALQIPGRQPRAGSRHGRLQLGPRRRGRHRLRHHGRRQPQLRPRLRDHAVRRRRRRP